jgi:tRNA(Ile)-lysidine synthase
MSLSSYSFKFNRHVEKFALSHDLFPPSGKLFIACSAGVDSMALLFFGQFLLEKKAIHTLEVLHINHGLRAQSVKEEAFLIEYCSRHNLTLHVKRLESPPQSNFEAWARNERYTYFASFLKNGDRLATAHHLDDAFEWHLLQQFKSSGAISYGIPLQRAKIIRPFLCVTKKQIEKLAVHNQIPFFQDQSNFETKYERNFVRLEVILPLQKRFPKYLKHFAQRSCELYQRQKQVDPNFIVRQDSLLGVHVQFQAVPQAFDIIKFIKSVSDDSRGSLQKEVNKLIHSIQNDGTGPMDFSGGVKIYFSSREMLIINRQQSLFYKKLDQKIFAMISDSQFSQMSLLVKDFFKLPLFFPRFIISNDPWLKKNLKPIRSKHPLFPITTSHLVQNTQWFCSANQLLKLCHKHPKYFDQVISIINLHPALETA